MRNEYNENWLKAAQTVLQFISSVLNFLSAIIKMYGKL